jgi:hypothetical protein
MADFKANLAEHCISEVVKMHSIAASRSRRRPSSHRFAVRSRATSMEPFESSIAKDSGKTSG